MCLDCFLPAVTLFGLSFKSHTEGEADKNTEDVSKETYKVWEPCRPFDSHCADVYSMNHMHPSYLGQRAQLE